MCPLQASLPCVDSVVLDVDSLGLSQTSSSQGATLSHASHSISLEPLSPPQAPPTAPADITTALTSENTHTPACLVFCVSEMLCISEVSCCVSAGGHRLFNRTSVSLVCEVELSDLQASLDLYDDNKS